MTGRRKLWKTRPRGSWVRTSCKHFCSAKLARVCTLPRRTLPDAEGENGTVQLSQEPNHFAFLRFCEILIVTIRQTFTVPASSVLLTLIRQVLEERTNSSILLYIDQKLSFSWLQEQWFRDRPMLTICMTEALYLNFKKCFKWSKNKKWIFFPPRFLLCCSACMASGGLCLYRFLEYATEERPSWAEAAVLITAQSGFRWHSGS